MPGRVLMKTGHVRTFGRRAERAQALSRALPRVRWKSAGMLALLCSGVAWASLPRPVEISTDRQRQWQALEVAPLANGGTSGMRMGANAAVEPVEFVPARAIAPVVDAPAPPISVTNSGPFRIRGRVGDGLYWSLRAAGASPQVAAQYLAALATEIDVGEVAANDSFDMVLGRNRDLLYAGLDRG